MQRGRHCAARRARVCRRARRLLVTCRGRVIGGCDRVGEVVGVCRLSRCRDRGGCEPSIFIGDAEVRRLCPARGMYADITAVCTTHGPTCRRSCCPCRACSRASLAARFGSVILSSSASSGTGGGGGWGISQWYCGTGSSPMWMKSPKVAASGRVRRTPGCHRTLGGSARALRGETGSEGGGAPSSRCRALVCA